MSNRITKERQWKRPTAESEQSVSDAISVSEESKMDSNALPPGWREAFDKKSNRVYYVNE